MPSVKKNESDTERIARLDRLAYEHRNEKARMRREAGALQGEIERLTKLLDRYAVVSPKDLKVPTWLAAKPKKGGKKRATAVLMLSDLHLDEVVNLAETQGLNEYGREIAERRLREVINSTVKLCKDYVAGVEFDGIMVAIIGDIITGVIHEELARTNEAPVPASIAYWVPILCSALRYLADEFGQVFVPCVDGNHDRTYGKIPSKQRAESSFAWIIYNWMADNLRDDPRIQFRITPAADQIVKLYDTTFLLSHGDQFRSQGGVGGIYPSLLKWLLRAHELYSQAGTPFDYALLGHWHQLKWLDDCIINGSLKGYDEYAITNKFKFEKPQQALFIVTPERGVVQRLPVFAD